MTTATLPTGELITHGKDSITLESHQKRLKETPHLTLPLEEELALLDSLMQFDLGRFLLTNKGLNGYWTAYFIIHGPKKENVSELEYWMLHKAPGFIATRERFQIFKQQLQFYLKSNSVLASLPCGLMDDLLDLDYSQVDNVKLFGFDLDSESLVLAKENADSKGLPIEVFKKDAWNLGMDAELDILTSNGLNIYEPDEQKIIALYRECNKALKPSGIFITSFLTPPPILSPNSPWKNCNLFDLIKQKALFGDIIQASFQAYQTEEKTIEQLKEAGFEVIQIIYDSQCIFPTVTARKIAKV